MMIAAQARAPMNPSSHQPPEVPGGQQALVRQSDTGHCADDSAGQSGIEVARQQLLGMDPAVTLLGQEGPADTVEQQSQAGENRQNGPHHPYEHRIDAQALGEASSHTAHEALLGAHQAGSAQGVEEGGQGTAVPAEPEVSALRRFPGAAIAVRSWLVGGCGAARGLSPGGWSIRRGAVRGPLLVGGMAGRGARGGAPVGCGGVGGVGLVGIGCGCGGFAHGTMVGPVRPERDRGLP